MALAGVGTGLSIGPLAVQARFVLPAERNAVVTGLTLFVRHPSCRLDFQHPSHSFPIVSCVRRHRRPRTMRRSPRFKGQIILHLPLRVWHAFPCGPRFSCSSLLERGAELYPEHR